MKNKLKLSLIIGLFSFSSFAMASSNWNHDTSEAFKYPIKGQGNITIYQSTDEAGPNGTVEVNYGVTVSDKNCKSYEQNSSGEGVITVNGQLIKVNQQCVDEGALFYYALTDGGAKFIENEFSKNENVLINIYGEEHIYTTDGFTKAKSVVEVPLNAL